MSTVEGYFAVARRRRVSAAWCGLALAATIAGCGTPPGGTPPDQVASGGADGAPAITLTEEHRSRLATLELILRDEDASPEPDEVRALVADLVSIDLPRVTGPMTQGLRGDDAAVIVGIAQAIADAQPSPPHLLDPATAAMRTAPKDAIAPLAAAIVRYGDPGRGALTSLATDRTLPPSRRVGPVLGLGTFQSRAAAADLMLLLDVDRDEPELVTTAACRSLGKLTGLDHGGDPAAWREWWRTARQQTQQEWLRSRIAKLSDDVIERDWRIEQQRREATSAQQRLAEVYRRLLDAMTPAERTAEIAVLLEDESAVLRRLAVGRIERLMRDKSMPAPMQSALAGRLDDPDSLVRLQAAELLDEARYEGIAEYVASRLTGEADPVVVAAYLRILANKPVASTLPDIRRWLRDGDLAPVAADALWQLALASGIPDDELLATQSALASALRAAPSPPLARAVAFLGTERDLARVRPRLDGEDDDIKRAVAEGFAARGRLEPLLERADDPVIYPVVLAQLSASRPSLDGIRKLVRLAPSATQRTAWAAAVRKMAAELDPGLAVQAFEVLRGSAHADDALRRDVLEPAATAPEREITNETRVAVLGRLAPILFRLGEAQRAHLLLQQVTPPEAGRDPLGGHRLEAALRVGAFDDAAAVTADPTAWVDMLEELVETNAAAARTVCDEIATRFADQLVGDLRSKFDRISATVPDETPRGTAAAQDDGDP